MCLGEGKDLPGSLGGTDPHHRPGCGVLVPPHISRLVPADLGQEEAVRLG